MDTFETMSTASTTEGRLTPTHTAVPEAYDPRKLVESIPAADCTFIIRHRETGRIIALVDGDLRLCDGNGIRDGFYWHCVRKDGWLGFRNSVSGTYIGRYNESKRYTASAKKHLSHEFFNLLPNRKGGYEFLTRHGDEQWSMAVAEDGATLVEVKGEGALWDFLEPY